MSVPIAVVCEAKADFTTAATLVDGVLCQRVEWIEPEVLDDYRQYRSLHASNDADHFLQWSQVKSLARERGITVQGFFKGLPASPDAHTAMKALLMFERAEKKPLVVILLRDSDCDLTRLDGLQQARGQEPWSFQIAVGLAHTKRECWLIAGFEVEHAGEDERLAQLRGDFPPGVGFDARLYSERLTAKQEGVAKLDAKRVLHHLCQGDSEREQRCLSQLLREAIASERGERNGMKAFLEEIVQRVLPLFIPQSR